MAEAMLVKASCNQHPVALSRTAALLFTRLDPDRSPSSEDELEHRRAFTLHRRGAGAFARPDAQWTPELTAIGNVG